MCGAGPARAAVPSSASGIFHYIRNNSTIALHFAGLFGASVVCTGRPATTASAPGSLCQRCVELHFWGLAMKTGLHGKSLLRLAIVILPLVVAPAAFSQQNPNLDKHARKVEKKLARFRNGSFVQIDFRNGSQSIGSLGTLSAASFQIADADNNQQETYSYDDVADVRKGRQYIGEGSEPGHRPRFLVPVLVSAAAAAATVAIVESVR
jgi:hypothetical protein